jgi:hypothetical protein
VKVAIVWCSSATYNKRLVAPAMPWVRTSRADARAAALADRHYSRKTVGAAQFVPPGRCLVLLTEAADALWVSSWPYTQYVKHAWAGAWLCSLFRNESAYLSSDLIRWAVSATCFLWGPAPEQGIITFVDPTKVRKKRDWGRCYRRAGWQQVGYTRNGLVVLQQRPCDMPAPVPACGVQLPLLPAVQEMKVRC